MVSMRRIADDEAPAGGAQIARRRLWPRLAGAVGLVVSVVLVLIGGDFARFIARLDFERTSGRRGRGRNSSL